MSARSTNKNVLSTVNNALSILKSFTEEEPEQTVKSLSEKLEINKSVTSRLLSTLAKEGFIHKIPGTQRFRLGTAVLSLSGVIMSTLELYKEAMPILEHLVEVTGETAHLAVLENFHTVYLCKVNCEHLVQTMTHIGRRNPLHCTGSGKILAAYTNKKIVKELIERGLKSYTPQTITDPDQLLNHLKKVRAAGYAVDIEEHAPGVASVSAPVYDYTREVIAAVNIVGPIQRVHAQTIPTLIKHVKHAATALSQQMGYIAKQKYKLPEK